MAIILKSKANSGNNLNLSTVSQNKQFRSKRVKDDLDRVFEEHSTKLEAAGLKMPYIDLYGFPIDTAHLKTINKEDTIRCQIGVFSVSNKEIFIATPEPAHDGQKELLATLKSEGFKVKIYFCSRDSFDKLVRTFDQLVQTVEFHDDINVTTQTIADIKSKVADLTQMSELLQHTSMSNMIENILIGAIENKASDIHLEPEKDSYHLRLRLDGILYTFAELPKESQKTIESRIKLLSKTKLNVNNVPQDGRFSFKYEGRDIDVRVSMLPSNYGYSIVMRLLGTNNVKLLLDDLGFTGIAKERVEAAITKPQGLILTTGPTGSGKTTTLYTFLSTLNDSKTKIITLEDPIEYKLAGISQTQIDAETEYTFAAALRSILRQDPDILMVGEIRDAETAEIAVQASLTGHQVLSTIHTNDAAGAIPRLMELGVKGFLLADSLSVIIGQRLVRRLCPFCKYKEKPTEAQQTTILAEIAKLPPIFHDKMPKHLAFYKSKGCDKCNNMGYKGRIGVYEVMTITDGLRNLLANQFPSTLQVRNVATQEGMLTMFQDGMFKAMEGLTSIEELITNVQT